MSGGSDLDFFSVFSQIQERLRNKCSQCLLRFKGNESNGETVDGGVLPLQTF